MFFNFKNINTLLAISICLLLSISATAQKEKVQDLIRIAKEEAAIGANPGEVLARWLRADDAIRKLNHEPLPEISMAIAKIYQKEALYEQALPYYLEALPILESKAGFEQQKTTLYQQLGESYAKVAKPDSAAYFYNRILTNHQHNNNLNGQVNTLQKIVDAYSDNKDYWQALEYNLQLKTLLESHQRTDKELMLIYNNLGYNYNHLKQYEDAIKYFEYALKYLKKKDYSAKVILDVNIGIAYYNLGEFDKSILYLQEAKKTKAKYAPNEIDEINHLTSTVYYRKKDYHNALIFSEQSTELAQSNNNHALLSDIYYTTALIHSDLYEYDQALEYFQKHLQLRDSFELEDRFRRQQLLQQKIDLERSEKQIKLRISNEDIQQLTIEQLEIEKEKQELELEKQAAQLASEQKQKELLQKDIEIKASNLATQQLETERTKQDLELTRQRLLSSKKEQEVIALQQKEEVQQLELEKTAAQLASEQQEKDLILQEKKLSDLALEQQQERVQNFYKIVGLMALIFLFVAGGLLYSRKLNRQLNLKNEAIEKQKQEITSERNKSDQLLLNILPSETAQELKEKGFASPKKYDNATVLFTDFSGFTRVASTMSPEQLIEELNYCFKHFDTILEKHGLEKIKTIGDAYMCVAGVPVPKEQHATRSIKAGQEIINFMNKRIKEKRDRGQDYWDMRMGIHSGPVVAGVVGKKKFAYDIWGDTVNVASRMESNGEVGRINISEATYHLVKDQFRCEARGKINAKNVGDVNMYFVKG